MIQLDTNYLVAALRVGTREERQLDAWLRADVQISISALAWAEFLCGPIDEPMRHLAEKVITNIEPLYAEDAEAGSRLFNLTGRRSRSLADCLIAAVALRCRARLATNNVADFKAFAEHGVELL